MPPTRSPTISVIPPSRPARRYLGLLAAIASLLTVLLSLFNWYGFTRGFSDLPEARLLRGQVDKLAAAPAPDVLLLGDSSLANAVDAAAWSRESGLAVLAVPLAGYTGYEGTLNMLRRTLRRHRPELVVIMQTIELAARDPVPQGTLLTAETWGDLDGVMPWHIVSYFASAEMTRSIVNGLLEGPGDPRGVMQGGFVRQKAMPDFAEVSADQKFLAPSDLNSDKLEVLARIAQLCDASSVRCVYAHGPYLEPACSAARDYLAELDRRIRAMGLEVLGPSPLCFTAEQAGDQPDHVKRALRPLFSEAYRRLVLGPAPAAQPSFKS